MPAQPEQDDAAGVVGIGIIRHLVQIFGHDPFGVTEQVQPVQDKRPVEKHRRGVLVPVVHHLEKPERFVGPVLLQQHAGLADKRFRIGGIRTQGCFKLVGRARVFPGGKIGGSQIGMQRRGCR